MAGFFNGIYERMRTSFMREWDWQIRTIANTESLSDPIDFRFCAGLAVSIDGTMDGTHIGIWACHEENGTYRQVYDKDDTALVCVAEDAGIMVMHPEVFPLGWIKLASCSDTDGTLETETADRNFVVHVKP